MTARLPTPPYVDRVRLDLAGDAVDDYRRGATLKQIARYNNTTTGGVYRVIRVAIPMVARNAGRDIARTRAHR